MKEDLRHQLFDTYSKNLELVTGLLKTSDEHQVLIDTYICPICERPFTRDHLNTNLPNYLSIEHVPPSNVGWQKKILTCRECNTRQGGNFDGHVGKFLNQKAFNLRIPGTKVDVRASYKGHDATCVAEISHDRNVIYTVDKKRSNPASIAVIDEALRSEIHAVSFNPKRAKMKPALISMIRAAYLWGFAEFGYAFIQNPNLDIVRRQLLEPDEDLFFGKYVLTGKFPPEWQGLHLVDKPAGAEGYAFIMNFVAEGVSDELCVLLPGADSKAFSRLNFLREEITRERPDLDLQPVQDPDYLTREDRCLHMLMYWLEKYEFTNDADY